MLRTRSVSLVTLVDYVELRHRSIDTLTLSFTILYYTILYYIQLARVEVKRKPDRNAVRFITILIHQHGAGNSYQSHQRARQHPTGVDGAVVACPECMHLVLAY